MHFDPAKFIPIEFHRLVEGTGSWRIWWHGDLQRWLCHEHERSTTEGVAQGFLSLSMFFMFYVFVSEFAGPDVCGLLGH